MYVDTSNVIVRQITKAVARDFIIQHHYSHRFSSCRYALGIYYEEKEEHPFFSGTNEKLIGALIFGHPVCNKTVDSITADASLHLDDVLELTRLVILDGYGSNIESFCLGQSFRWLKKHAPNIKVLVAYADPEYGHDGTIYKASNWIYQGIGASKLMPDYQVRLFPDSKWIHSRTVGAKFGPKNLRKLAEKIGHKFWRKEETSKHRYIYFLCNKKEKKEIMKKLKLPIVPYPKWTSMKPLIQEIEIINNDLVVRYIEEE
jgi:hypothetical protein